MRTNISQDRATAVRNRIQFADFPPCTKFALMSDLAWALTHDHLGRLLEVEARLRDGIDITVRRRLAEKSIDEAQTYANGVGWREKAHA